MPISIIGFGGIVVMNADEDHARRTVARAVEAGVNYFDVAPSYGNAEDRLGPALQPYRKDSFLACKTTERQADKARAELKGSLQRLRTDYFDLYQLHALADVTTDVDVAFAKGGAMEVIAEAKKAGQIRHVGFSAHSIEAALVAMDRYDFDSVLLPINFACFHAGGFGPAVLAKAQHKQVTVLALKAMARQNWPANHPDRAKYLKCWYQPVTDPREADLAVRFTLSQPVAAAIPPGEEELFWIAVDIGRRFRPLTEDESRQVQMLAAGLNPVFRAK